MADWQATGAERDFENVLVKIAKYTRGGVIAPGTLEEDRDAMIGLAREALMDKYGIAWRERVAAGVM